MEFEKVSIILKALADPKRMKIIDLLSSSNMCACELLEHFDFTQPTLSHHMKILEKAGLISIEKKGQWHHYALNNEVVDPFIDSIENLFYKENKE